MIVDILIFIGSSVLFLIGSIFSSFSLLIPVEITDSIIFAFSKVDMLSGIFPMASLMSAFGFVLSVVIAKYVIKIFFKFVLPFLPLFGRHIEPFQFAHVTGLRNTKGKLDLKNRQNWGKGRIDKTMRF